MELSHKAEMEMARSLKKLLAGKLSATDGDVVVCPSYVSLPAMAEFFAETDGIGVGAQHVHWEEKGAYTGSVSLHQISPFARWCIVGHSEQRRLTGLTDQFVSNTAALLIRHGIAPVVCLGETAEERDNDQTIERVTTQVNMLLDVMTRPALPHLVITYEPIWAISANNPDQSPDPNEVAGIILLVRKLVTARFGEDGAARVRMLYGGSVTDRNMSSFMDEPGIDGALVGGASIHSMKFVEIVSIAQASHVS